VDLRESITIADLGDIFTIPGNIEKTFDQISKAVSHVYSSGAFPVILGGDHSIGYPTTRGVAENLDGKLGIIHFDRHVDTQETDLDERMHTTPWFHATDLPNVPPENLVQIGIGGWQAPRPGVKVGRERQTTIMTVTDCVEMGIEEAAERALEVAWNGAEAVWLSFDVDCLDAAFVPGTGWPEPGGFLPREVLKFIQLIAERPLAGIEVVECSPLYDNAEITALISARVICDTLGCLVRAGHLPKAGGSDMR
jgi:agmatinase